MLINVKNKILDNLVSTRIFVGEMGSDVYNAEEEIELVKDYPRYVDLSTINFKSAMKIVDGLPTVTDDEADGYNIVDVCFKPIAKKYLIGPDLDIEFTVDSSKISKTELDGEVFKKPELLAQAKVILFATLVKKDIQEKLDEMRALDNKFEGETDEVL